MLMVLFFFLLLYTTQLDVPSEFEFGMLLLQ